MNIRSVAFFACAFLCAVANAQTQSDLKDDACEAYREADRKLNAIYQQLLEQAALVNHRIEQLSGWLIAEEGDVCRGSR